MHDQVNGVPATSGDATPRRTTDPARRGRRLAALLVVVCALAGAGAGLWWGLQQQSVHHATSVVLVNPLEGNPFSPNGRGDELVNLETEAQLVRSDTMGDLVGRALGEDPTSLLADISVSVPPNTQLLEVSAAGATAEQAALRAQAFTETYLAFRRTRAESTSFRRAAELEEQIRDREDQQEALSKELDRATPRSSRAAVLTQQVVNLNVQADELRAQLGATRVAAPNPGQVVTPAVSARAGLPGGVPTAVLAGLLAGAALGWVGGSGLPRRDGGTRDDDEDGAPAPRERLAVWPAPVLGTLPAVAPARALTTVRAALLAAEHARPLTVLVCHPADAPGSASAVGLARSLAAARLRTVLVDVSRPLGPPGRGLSDVLRGDVRLDDAALPEGSHLRLLGAGAHAADLDDALAGPAAAQLLAQLRADADVLLLVGGAADDARAQALAGGADTVLLEAPAEPGSGDRTAAALEVLARVGAPTAHLVLLERPAAAPVAPPVAEPSRAPAAGAGPQPVPDVRGLRPRPALRLRLLATRLVLGRPAAVPAVPVCGSPHHRQGGVG
ncbi:hypothetical protein [Nocardioides abyssi]|uniref:Polysaccharide chain length determinant N-terminal domain-containing protein n=1 Tax=Nocardioides abyssi TaxID=3058370 RepID=A0ABT8EUK8_9ACTN|nr:hypothetical protein [Nocardioides abyssi]MDN4161718.1 hypothetical protein [Nocardioides abyssi]